MFYCSLLLPTPWWKHMAEENAKEMVARRQREMGIWGPIVPFKDMLPGTKLPPTGTAS